MPEDIRRLKTLLDFDSSPYEYFKVDIELPSNIILQWGQTGTIEVINVRVRNYGSAPPYQIFILMAD